MLPKQVRCQLRNTPAQASHPGGAGSVNATIILDFLALCKWLCYDIRENK